MANGKFQHNMECVQFLYDYHARVAPKAGTYYNGFEKRIDAYKRQHNIPVHEQLPKGKLNMNSHLIPNKAQVRSAAETGKPSVNEELQFAQFNQDSISNQQLPMQEPVANISPDKALNIFAQPKVIK